MHSDKMISLSRNRWWQRLAWTKVTVGDISVRSATTKIDNCVAIMPWNHQLHRGGFGRCFVLTYPLANPRTIWQTWPYEAEGQLAGYNSVPAAGTILKFRDWRASAETTRLQYGSCMCGDTHADGGLWLFVWLGTTVAGLNPAEWLPYRVGSATFLRRKIGHAHDNSADSENVAGACEPSVYAHFIFRFENGQGNQIFFYLWPKYSWK